MSARAIGGPGFRFSLGIPQSCGHGARQLAGQTDLAVRAYERSLELDPNRADTLYNFANLLMHDPELPCSIAVFGLEPSAPSAWHNYGAS